MRRLLIYILCLVLTAVTAVADDGGTRSPFSLGAGSCDLAQGGANLASGDAATAAYWNASRLARAERFGFTGFHSRLYDSDVAYQYFGAVFPTLDWGSFGLGVFRLGVGGIEQRDADNVLIPGELDDNRMAFYLSYGRTIGGYDVGMSMTFEHHSLGDYNSTSSPGLDLSAGRTFDFKNDHIDKLSVALVGRNLVRPGMELVEERVDQPTAFDAAFSLALIPSVSRGHKANFSAAVTKVDEIDARFSAGLEYSFHDMVSLRGGVRDGKMSAGGGLSYKSLTFDYALVDRDLGSLHMFTVSTSFGTSLAEKKKQRASKREAEFNNLMNNRLASRNRNMIADLVEQGRRDLDEGNLVEADNHLDRALFLARSAGVDTTGIYELAIEASRRLQEVTDKQVYGRYMDSAQVRFDGGDYLAAAYFAGLALEKYSNSNEANEILNRANAAVEQSASREEMIVKQLISADSLLSYGRIDEALKIVRAMHEYEPDDERIRSALKKTEFEYYRNMAGTAFSAGDINTAEKAADSALILFPEHQWCLDIKARIGQERKRLAATDAQPRTASRQPTLNAELLKEVRDSYETARNLFEKGDLAEAIGYWEKVERLAPDYQSVRQYLVRAYKFVGVELYGQNRLQEAVDVWNKTARLAPENEEIKDYIKRTENEIRRLEELSYESE